jgi:hypothetical protein
VEAFALPVKLGDSCQICHAELGAIRCPICILVFCNTCVKAFHSYGKDNPWAFHFEQYQHLEQPPPETPVEHDSLLSAGNNKENWSHTFLSSGLESIAGFPSTFPFSLE